ncbi:hypothetical protein BJX62DRAFT_234278 [Aspergillus germanicus]
MSKKHSLAAASPKGKTKKRQHVPKKRKARKASPSVSVRFSFPAIVISKSASEEPGSAPVSAENPSSASPDCAERAFQEGDDGVIRPNYCIVDEPGARCMRCWDNEQDCEPLPQAFHSMHGRRLAMNPDSKALAAAEDFAVELRKALEASEEEDSTATQLKVLNRTLFLLLNDHRESASKEPLGEEHLVEWAHGWENAEKRLEKKYGL